MQKKNDVVKKTVRDKVVAKVNVIPLNNIDIRDFVLKTKYHTDKTEIENIIPVISNLLKNKNSLNQRTKLLILLIQQQKLH